MPCGLLMSLLVQSTAPVVRFTANTLDEAQSDTLMTSGFLGDNADTDSTVADLSTVYMSDQLTS